MLRIAAGEGELSSPSPPLPPLPPPPAAYDDRLMAAARLGAAFATTERGVVDTDEGTATASLLVVLRWAAAYGDRDDVHETASAASSPYAPSISSHLFVVRRSCAETLVRAIRVKRVAQSSPSLSLTFTIGCLCFRSPQRRRRVELVVVTENNPYDGGTAGRRGLARSHAVDARRGRRRCRHRHARRAAARAGGGDDDGRSRRRSWSWGCMRCCPGLWTRWC